MSPARKPSDHPRPKKAAPKPKGGDGADLIVMPGTSTRRITIEDGVDESGNTIAHTFVANFDDAGLLRQMLDLNLRVAEIAGDENKDVEERLRLISAFVDEGCEVIDHILGAGACKTLWGEARPIMRTMHLVGSLAQLAGPAYDAMFGK